MIVGLVAIGAGLSLQVPDYVDFQARADSLARAVTSVASCRTLGFDVPRVDPDLEAKAVIAVGAREGISAELAGAFVRDAVENETSLLATLNEAATDPSNQGLEPIRRHILWWTARCETLAENEIGRRFIRRSPDQEATAQRGILEGLEGGLQPTR